MKNESKIWSASRSLFFWFWNQLGSILGGFGRPSWTQVGTKWHQNPSTQPIKKLITFWIALGTDFSGFWWILLSNWGSKTLPLCVLFGHILALEARIHPRALQEPPKSLQEPNFGRFLIDLGWIVGGFLIDLLACRSVGSLLCCLSGLLAVCWSAVWPHCPRHGGGMPTWATGIYIYIYIYIYIHLSTMGARPVGSCDILHLSTSYMAA